MPSSSDRLILLTGGTGYVGGRLLTLLEQRGIRVRCLTRRRKRCERVSARRPRLSPGTSSIHRRWPGLSPASTRLTTSSIRWGPTATSRHEDRIAAENFAQQSAAAGVRRIIYLGGLGEPDQDLSKHLRSRQETGDVLRAHHPQVIEFRASIVIGSGSLSFEMIRALVERLPVMICPRWVQVKAQPHRHRGSAGVFARSAGSADRPVASL